MVCWMEEATNFAWGEFLGFSFHYALLGAAAVIGTILYGRHYRTRIRNLERQIDGIKGQAPTHRARETVLVMYKHGSDGPWHEQRLETEQGLMHRLRFDDAGDQNVIEMERSNQLIFTDPITGKLWYGCVDGIVRRYTSGPFAAGHGLKDVFVMIERSEDDG